jgi:phosphatidylglycerol phospholipase C
MDKWPENTEVSFDQALRSGSHAVETGLSLRSATELDVHMSADGMVVICHDAILKRLYGVDGTVSSLPWKDGLDQLRTIREPRSPMLTFRQFLEKMMSRETLNGSVSGENGVATRTSWKDAWVIIDIKVISLRLVLMI